MTTTRTFHDLALEDRAAALGISCRELVRVGQKVDRRILTAPSLNAPGSVARLKRWLAAGEPTPDFDRLVFAGSDQVRDVVVEVLKSVPPPVAWHGTEFVGWFEVGREAAGWQGYVPAIRAPEGDEAHMIALCGSHVNAAVRDLAAHELGHSWSRRVGVYAKDDRGRGTMSEREWNARVIVAARVSGSTPEALVRNSFNSERLADGLAVLWGYRPSYTVDDMTLMRHFRADQEASTELANEIERELEKEFGP